MSLHEYSNLIKGKLQKKHKYNAKPIVIDNIRFPSMAQGEFHQLLKLSVKAGEILFFLTDVPIRLKSGTKLIVDNLIFYSDGRYEFIDVKGALTPVFLLKKKQVEDAYPLKIKIAKKKGKRWSIY
jgi:hypothetical protein